MSGTTRWFVEREPDGRIARVVRVHEDARGLRGEWYRGGTWTQDGAVLAVLSDPSWGAPVSAADGEAAVAELEGAG